MPLILELSEDIATGDLLCRVPKSIIENEDGAKGVSLYYPHEVEDIKRKAVMSYLRWTAERYFDAL